MKKSKQDKDATYIHTVVTAAHVRNVMGHVGWPSIVAIINKLAHTAQTRSEVSRRTPSLDKMFEATHFDGQVQFAKNLLHTLSSLYDRAGAVLTEARDKLPRVPITEQPGKTDPPAPSGEENLKEVTDDRPEKPKPRKRRKRKTSRRGKADSGKV